MPEDVVRGHLRRCAPGSQARCDGLRQGGAVEVPAIRALIGADKPAWPGAGSPDPEVLGNGGTVEMPSSACVPCPCHPALRADISIRN